MGHELALNVDTVDDRGVVGEEVFITSGNWRCVCGGWGGGDDAKFRIKLPHRPL